MRAELTPKERMIRVLQRRVPDRVPHFEWLLDRKVREALLPGCRDQNEFAVRMGHDAILVDPIFRKSPLADGRYLSEWGYIGQVTQEEHGIEVESPIKTMADLERYKAPNPREAPRYEAIERALATYGEKYPVIVHLNDVFALPRYLMGMESLLMAIVAEPELVQALIDMSVEVNLILAHEIAERGAQFVYTGDDVASNTGPFMSPRHFRKLFYPGLCRVMRGYKELGLYVIKHSDGNLWPIIDMILDSGIDCLDPIDPQAGMDLNTVKAKYGDRIAIKGNVDCAQLMTFGTPEDVAEATRQALRAGMPGGGYICSSSNSIHSGVKPENYRAMTDTIRDCGRYH